MNLPSLTDPLVLVGSFVLIAVLATGSYDYDHDYGYTTPRITTYWPYDYKVYCWTSFNDCRHPASTPFPGVSWKQLNSKYSNRPFQRWWYPCFYYSEEALLSLSLEDPSASLTVKCDELEGARVTWINGTWFSMSPALNWSTGERIDDYDLFERNPQPSKLADFAEKNNFTGFHTFLNFSPARISKQTSPDLELASHP